MIFEITADQIRRLDQNQLVSLLRQLIEAELLKYDIPLRSGTVPAQINIPDGGDDGRISWSEGVPSTSWLPSRFTIFQCKKGTTTDSKLKAETWTKPSQKKDAPRESSKAIKEVLQQRGAYIIVTTSPVVGTAATDRIAAIREGIVEAGQDASLLSAVEIYDCNRLATWTNQHPPIALSLNSELREIHLGGFQSYSDWQKTCGMYEIPFQDSESPRFVAEGKESESRDDGASVKELQNFRDISNLIAKFYSESVGSSIRITGPSGYGKSRFVHELVDSSELIIDAGLRTSQVVYCIYEDVKDRLVGVVRDSANRENPALIIVDDCPSDQHTELMDIVNRKGSRTRLITIGVESKTDSVDENLVIRLQPAADDLIDGIAASINEQESQKNTQLIRDISQGFPRMAVLATKALIAQDAPFKSVEALVDRIIWGKSQPDDAALEALQIASLFSVLGMEDDAANELETIANFCNQPYRQMYRYLTRFKKRGVLIRQGDYGAVQPVPLAVRLASHWIQSTPSGTLSELYNSLSDRMKNNMLGKLRWLSWMDDVSAFAVALAHDVLPDYATLNSSQGAMLLDRLVYLAPDSLMQRLELLLKDKSIEDLITFDKGRRYTIHALEKLTFPRQTFPKAAQCLLRLAAAENERWANNAVEQFLSLYHLYLSGTEAVPTEKLKVIDDGLLSTDQRVRKICIDALGRMLKSNYFSRTGGSERIGTVVKPQDWQPTTYDEVYDYYKASLTRLEKIVETDEMYASLALTHISAHLKSLLNYQALYDDLEQMILRLLQNHPRWYGPVKALNTWLFFNTKKVSEVDETYPPKLRALYNKLLPQEPLELLLLYSSGGNIDFHDPDKPYDPATSDHDYVDRKIKEIISHEPVDAAHYASVIDTFASGSYALAMDVSRLIARHVSDPESLLDQMLAYDFSIFSIDTLTILTRGIILGIAQTNRSNGMRSLRKALTKESLQPRAVELITAVSPDDKLVNQLAAFIRAGVVKPYRVQNSILGACLEDTHQTTVQGLFSALAEKGAEGAWALIDILHQWSDSSDLSESWIAETIVASVTNPDLFGEVEHCSGRDYWYGWHSLFEKIVESSYMNAELCSRLLNFTTTTIEPSDSGISHSGENYISKALLNLTDDYAEQVWNHYHDSIVDADMMHRHRLKRLFTTEPTGNANGGVFNNIPAKVYTSWMTEDKHSRMEFILSWIKLFNGGESDPAWSTEFVHFVDTYTDEPEQLDALYTRLTTGTFIGHYSNLLETRLEQLHQLRNIVTNSFVKQWLDKLLPQLNDTTANQRRNDTNFKTLYLQ